VTLVGASDLHSLARRYRHVLDELPGLDVVPEPWLHLTVQGVGWSDEVTDAERARIVAGVRRSLDRMAPISAALGPAVVKGEAIVLPATPVPPLRELHSVISDEISAALGRPPLGGLSSDFLPHVSLAYSHIDADASPYAEALESVSEPAARATIRDVTLIRQERLLEPERLYRWTELDRVPLGVHSDTGPPGAH
jgi:2'-5' RNA ligase